MADKQVIIEFKVEGSEALNMTVALTDKLNELKAQKKELEKALKEDGGNKALKEQLAQVNAQIGSTNTSLRGYQNELKNMVKANEQETNSLKQKQAQLSVLTAQWDRLSEAERNSQKGLNLKGQIDDTMTVVKGLEESTNRFQRNVGNYTNGAKQALRELTVELQNLAVQNANTEGEIKAQEIVLQGLAKTVGVNSQEYQTAAEKLNQMKESLNGSRNAMSQMEQQAGQIRDAIGDVNTRIKSFANDQQRIAAAQEGVQVLAGSYALLQTTMKALGFSSESLLQVWAKVELVQKSMNALMTISKALNKDSNLMIVLRSQLTKTQTAYQTAYVNALTATNAAEGVGVKLAPKVIAGVKGIGAAIKSIPGIGWVTAIVGALTTLLPLIRKTNKEFDNSAKSVKGLSVSATDATVRLQLSVGYLKTCKQGTEQWAGAVTDVAKQLGVSEDWLKQHMTDIDAITKKWVDSQIAMAQAQAAITRIVDLQNQRGDIQNQFTQLRKLMSRGSRELAIDFAKENFGDAVVKTVKAYFANLNSNQLKDEVLAALFGGKDDITKSFIKPIDDAIRIEIQKANKMYSNLTKTTVEPQQPTTTEQRTDVVVDGDDLQVYEDAAQKILDSVNKMRTELYKMGMDATQRAKFDLQQEWNSFDTEINNQLEGLQTKLADPKTTDAQKEQIQSLIRFYLDLMDQQDAIFQQRMDQYDVVQEKTQEIVQNQIETLDGVWWKLDENQKKSLETADIIMKSTAQAAGSIAGLLNEVAGDNEELQKYAKAAGMVQILMSMGTGIAQAISAGSGLIFPANLVAIATGVATVVGGITSAIQLFKQTEAVAAPKFAQGGYVSGKGTGTSDDIMAWLSNGESVMTARTTKMFAPMLSAMNVAGGGAPITQAEQNNTMRTMWESAFAEMPAPVVSVKEVTNVANRVRIKENISSN